jgi:hypothetical protein
MIEDAPIVQDTRKVRGLISEQFDHDIDKYLDYLSSQETKTNPKTPKKRKVGKIRKSSKKPVSA